MSATSSSAGESTSLAGRDLALLIGMNLIWGLNLIASKIGVGEFPPIFFTAMRFGSLALFLVPMLKIHRGQMTNLFAAAMLSGPAAFALLFAGIFLAEDAATVAVATQMSVPFATLMSVLFLGERIHWRRIMGIVLAFAGIVVISFDPRVFAYWEGLALVVCSSFVSSLGLIFLKRLKGIQPLEVQSWIALAGGSILLVLSLGLESGQMTAVRNATWAGWGALFFTTIMSSLVAHTAWFYLVGRYPVTSLSPLTLLSPLFGIFFGVTLLHDQMTPRMLVGGAVTLIGVLIVVLREKRIADTGT
ncbi:MAG TPA: DMT family transporter [Steroidobacteraceae bacterium]|nr:DMT family transporter [Steroidobacteraceae bacterium]